MLFVANGNPQNCTLDSGADTRITLLACLKNSICVGRVKINTIVVGGLWACVGEWQTDTLNALLIAYN